MAFNRAISSSCSLDDDESDIDSAVPDFNSAAGLGIVILAVDVDDDDDDDDDDDNIDDDVIAEVNTSPLPPSSPTVSTSRILSVGKGIVSRAILTGTTWNIVGSLFNEPDFYPLSIETCCADEDDIATSGGSNKSTGSSITDHGHFRDLVVVPILDAKGTPIAVS